MSSTLHPSSKTTVGELGEAGILALLEHSYAGFTTKQGVIGPGDDAAVIPATNGHFVIATDAMNEGHHVLRHWPSGVVDNGDSTGWKLVAQDSADMNRVGASSPPLQLSAARCKRNLG